MLMEKLSSCDAIFHFLIHSKLLELDILNYISHGGDKRYFKIFQSKIFQNAIGCKF